MTTLSDFSENALIDHLTGVAAMTVSPGTFLALFTDDPTDAATGTEVASGGYARQAVTFTAAASGTTANAGSVSFTAAGGNYGTVTHVAVYDDVSAGNMLMHTALTTSRTVNDGETLTFAIGNLTLALT